MSNREILEKAIQKAIAGGWKDDENGNLFQSVEFNGDLVGSYQLAVNYDDYANVFRSINDIIFDHEFCKALWGEEEIGWSATVKNIPISHSLPGWGWHLQQMVLSQDPIKYLGENI